MSNTWTGTVKTWKDEKGFGFIVPDGGGSDIFCHFSGIVQTGRGRRNLVEGQRVTFEVVEGQKGREARNVAPAEPGV